MQIEIPLKSKIWSLLLKTNAVWRYSQFSQLLGGAQLMAHLVDWDRRVAIVWVLPQAESLCCVLEQDTLSPA